MSAQHRFSLAFGAAASILGHPAAVIGFTLLFLGFFGWAERVETNTYRPAPLWLFFALLAAVAAARFAFSGSCTGRARRGAASCWTGPTGRPN